MRWFEVKTALPIVMRTIRKELTAAESYRLTKAWLWASLPSLPEGAGWSRRNSRLARQQFRSALRLYDALHLTIPDEQRATAMYTEIVSSIGAKFVAQSFALPAERRWRDWTNSERLLYLQRAAAAFFNARSEGYQVDEKGLGFSVRACQFVEMSHALMRPQMAHAFCLADSLRFARPDSLVQLRRESTLAQGNRACDFYFEFVSAPSGPALSKV